MKRYTILIFIILLLLTGCNIFNQNNSENKYNNNNLNASSPVQGEDLFIVDNTKTYYQSNDLNLNVEINGFYTIIKYFTIDETDKNIRIYDNIYLYENDYFYMLSEDLKDWYADLSENVSDIYAVKEIEEGEDYSILIKKEGIYRIIFDLETKQFDLIYLDEIKEAKYIKIKNCEVCQFIDKKANYTKMETNPNNSKELMLLNYTVNNNTTLYFFNLIHVSNYKIHLNAESLNTIAKYANRKRQGITLLIDGSINIYLNTETYEVRIEQN